MRRFIVEDEHGNRGYLPECHGLCDQGRQQCNTPTSCRSQPVAAQCLIVWVLALVMAAWIAWQIVAGIVDWVKS